MAERYTRCRALGHAWFEADSTRALPAVRGATPVTLRCERCMTERLDLIDANGDLARPRRYVYPDDYRYATGTLPAKGDFRLALLALRLQETRQARRKSSA